MADRERQLKLERERQQQHVKNYMQAAEPVLKDLEAVGFRVSSVGQLGDDGRKYRSAIPVLLKWLPQVSYQPLKEDIVRTLTVPWARPQAAPLLIEEFIRERDYSESNMRWVIANALETVARDAEFEKIVSLVQDKQYGRAREMLAMGLGHMKNPQAIPVLLGLLDDEDVVGHAVIALGRLRARAALPRLRIMAEHPTTWIRQEVRKALARIEAGQAR